MDTNPTYEVADLLKENDYHIYYLVVKVGIDVIVYDPRQNTNYPLPLASISKYLKKVG